MKTCECCGKIFKKEKPESICCDPIRLNFLGSGCVLLFIWMQHAVFLLLALFVGCGIYDIYLNTKGEKCEKSYNDYLKSKFIDDESGLYNGDETANLDLNQR